LREAPRVEVGQILEMEVPERRAFPQVGRQRPTEQVIIKVNGIQGVLEYERGNAAFK
jgi:hypothetical protein